MPRLWISRFDAKTDARSRRSRFATGSYAHGPARSKTVIVARRRCPDAAPALGGAADTAPGLFRRRGWAAGRYLHGPFSGARSPRSTLAGPWHPTVSRLRNGRHGFKRRRITLTEPNSGRIACPRSTFSAGNPVGLRSAAPQRCPSGPSWMVLSSPLGNRFLNAPLRPPLSSARKTIGSCHMRAGNIIRFAHRYRGLARFKRVPAEYLQKAQTGHRCS